MKQYFVNMLPALLTAAVSILTPLTTFVLTKFKTYVTSKTDNEMVASAMERLTHTTQTIVDSLFATMVPALVAASADGQLSASDLQAIRDAAKTALMIQLSDEIKNGVSLGVTNLSEFVDTKINQAIGKVIAAKAQK